MSVMNCSTAIQTVLDGAASRMDNLVVIRVDAEKSAEPAISTRRVTLPLSDDLQLSFAAGCAQAGMRPVLDLTAVRGAVDRLEAALAALPRASRVPFVVRVRGRRCPALPGAHVIVPTNARECAGAMRFALQAERICVIVENPLIAYEVCDVPNDPAELFAGTLPQIPEPEEEPAPVAAEAPEETAPEEEEAPAEPAEVPAPEEIPAEPEESPVEAVESPEPDAEPADEPASVPAPAEESLPSAALPPSPVTAPVPRGEMAFRTRAYDPTELARTAQLLGVSREELAALCCAPAGEQAEIILETDGEPGETACIPPEKADACLWVGRDHLTLCWNARAMGAQAARALLNDTAALLELPARLILKDRA